MIGEIKVGIKVKFAEEKQSYMVRACNTRYAVCTKPFNLKRTVLYTIIDLLNEIRGTEDLIFCYGAKTDKECEEMLKRLSKGETSISRRNNVPLKIERIR